MITDSITFAGLTQRQQITHLPTDVLSRVASMHLNVVTSLHYSVSWFYYNKSNEKLPLKGLLGLPLSNKYPFHLLTPPFPEIVSQDN